MLKNHTDLRKLWDKFWQSKNHKYVPPISLVPKDDPTTLFTGSGMQQLISYLAGEPHPLGKRLYNIQPCFRSQDIEEIGDNRHTTFFEMIGNWSLGDYFKEEQLAWCWEFYHKELNLPKERLYVTVFAGTKNVPRDEESATIWKKLGVKEDHIFYYGVEKNWWSRAGSPEKMPPGEIGGPDSEIFYDFGEDLKIHENSPFKNKPCHPNCDCGRFLEIGNSVFIQYKKEKNGSLSLLPQKNVDFGGGLERILAVCQNNPDIFLTKLYQPAIKKIEELTEQPYHKTEKNQKIMRIVVDHIKAATFIINDGVYPSNKEQGYILRRLLRRAIVKIYQLKSLEFAHILPKIALEIIKIYQPIYFSVSKSDFICEVINKEVNQFQKILNHGIKKIKKIKQFDAKVIFDLYQSYGLPFEITSELLKEKGIIISKEEFENEYRKHQQISRNASLMLFKGGLADHSQQTIKYHTATHLLHQALRDVLGKEVRQEGSNITKERLRFDFYYFRLPTEEEIKKIEEIINQKIKEKLPVYFKIMKKEEALKIGALAFFKEKYGEKVKVYFIGNYSKEFCGGPHVKNTEEIGSIKITKVKKIGNNIIRIYAQ